MAQYWQLLHPIFKLYALYKELINVTSTCEEKAKMWPNKRCILVIFAMQTLPVQSYSCLPKSKFH